MNVYFNRTLRRSPWGGGAHFHSAMADFLEKKGHKVVDTLYSSENIDLIFMLDPRPEEGGADINEILGYKRYHNQTKILHRVNECDKRKNTNFLDDILLQSMNLSDGVVFISEWLQSYFHQIGFSSKSDIVYNGSNLEWFYPQQGKTLDKSSIKIVTHHWSDNWMKGFDLYTYLDKFVETNENFSFTYVGRYNNSYTPKNTKIIPPLYGKDLGDELRKYDIYVTASRFEPCGMHHIEGAASGLPVLYHIDGGAIVDVCKHHGMSFRDNNEFNNSLDNLVKNYDKIRNSINYDKLDLNSCCNKYYQIMLEMIK